MWKDISEPLVLVRHNDSAVVPCSKMCHGSTRHAIFQHSEDLSILRAPCLLQLVAFSLMMSANCLSAARSGHVQMRDSALLPNNAWEIHTLWLCLNWNWCHMTSSGWRHQLPDLRHCILRHFPIRVISRHFWLALGEWKIEQKGGIYKMHEAFTQG